MISSQLIIRTKLFPPVSRKALLTRFGLTEIAGTASTKKLVLVHAPAGYGKTSLLGQWHKTLENNKQLACWLSIDEPDANPADFIRYIIGAFQQVDADFLGDAAKWIEGRLQPDITVILNHVINELIRINRPITLFVDDYHNVNSTEIHQFFERLVNWSPENFALVIGSRVIPPMSLGKWRVADMMVEVDVNALRFSGEEASAFLASKTELQLSGEQIASIVEKSEGWAAGLQLVAIALQHCEQRDEFIASFSGNLYEIADYLTNNVLQRQSQDLTFFLLATSILSRFNADICNVLTGRNDSQSVLEQLENDGLFTLPLDTGRKWYRYQHLFHDFLLSRLRKQYPHEVLGLHQKAANWFREQGHFYEAFDYALLSNDLGIVADIHQDAIAINSLMGRMAQAHAWLSRIPESVKDKFPRLLILEGLALALMNRPDGAETVQARLRLALDALSVDCARVDPGELRQLEREALIIPAAIASVRDDNAEILRLTEDVVDKPVDNLMMAALYDTRGYAYFRRGQFAESKELLSKAWQYFSMIKECYGMALVDSIAGMVDIHQLNYLDACRLFERSQLASADPKEGSTFGYGLASTMLAVVYYEWNRIEEALTLLQSNLSLIEEFSLPLISCYGYTTLARCYIALGEFDAADNALMQSSFHTKHCDSDFFSAWIARERLILERNNKGKDSYAFDLEEYQSSGCISLPDHWDVTCYFVYANQICLKLSEGKTDGAEAQLTLLRKYAEKHNAFQAVLGCLLLEAQVFSMDGRHESAVQCVLQAVTLGRPSRLLRTFVDEGVVIRELLMDSLKMDSLSVESIAYIKEILAAFGLRADALQLPNVQSPPAEGKTVQLDGLSRRELQVLELLSNGKTNAEIADQLCVAKATVKFHVGNIFSKLNVTNRTLAAAAARSSGLIR